jgi:hypothetical protein
MKSPLYYETAIPQFLAPSKSLSQKFIKKTGLSSNDSRFQVEQPGCFTLKPVAFRPCLTTGLANILNKKAHTTKWYVL